MIIKFARLCVVITALCVAGFSAQAETETYSSVQLINTGHGFFGKVSSGLATVIEAAVRRHGEPNGYILGEEGSGAIVGGLRFGEGALHTRNAGTHKVFWQGPSLGFDFGGDANRTMMLVYKLQSVEEMYRRFGGVNGSAYFIGGFGMTVLVNDPVVLVPVRSGIGARLGINVGYLKFTRKATWNPF